MDMSGEYRIEASIDQVWAAIQNPDILKAAIPGCEELDKTSDTEMEARSCFAQDRPGESQVQQARLSLDQDRIERQRVFRSQWQGRTARAALQALPKAAQMFSLQSNRRRWHVADLHSQGRSWRQNSHSLGSTPHSIGTAAKKLASISSLQIARTSSPIG